jgi:O-acetylserine/cysteine efflux transporter
MLNNMRLSHYVLILLVVMTWAFNFVVIKTGLQEISPLLLGFSRFFLTSIPAVFFIKRPAAPFRMIILYGLFIFALQFGLLFMAMHAGVTPGLASLVLQLQVFFTILLGILFFDEKSSVWQVVGALVAFLGVGLVAMNLGGNVTFTGILLVVGAAASWGTGNVISKKIGKVDMVSLVVWGSLVAWPVLLALALIVDGPDKALNTLLHLEWISVGSVLYITYLSTLFGFGVWSWLLHQHPIGSVAPFTLLVPVFAILSSVLVLNEPLQTWKIVATLLVIAGLCINLLGPRLFPQRQ